MDRIVNENTFALSKAQETYLKRRMNEVSRSFALVVPSVEAPLSHFLSTAYLICRVIDNIEDCAQQHQWQVSRLHELKRMLSEPDSAGEVLDNWGHLSWPGLTEDERNLMRPSGGSMLWQIYALVPSRWRESIFRWTSDMAQGVSLFEDPVRDSWVTHSTGVRVLSSEADYNRYCYYVAGTVGNMATERAIDFYGLSGDTSERLLGWAEACGRGLQKTNIVKDFAADLSRGVCYLPNEWLDEIGHSPLFLGGAHPEWALGVIRDVLSELRDATQYVLALPYTAAGYRMASLLCLLPAYETLMLAAERSDRLFTAEHSVKISRVTMAACKRNAGALISDNDAVSEYSRRAERSVEQAFERALGTA